MNKKFTAMIGLLMAVAVTGYSVSGTYAKYTESFNATSTAKVARWHIQFGESSSKSDTFTFDLFKNATNSSLNAGAVGSETVIAPGSTGDFTIKLYNDSDVNAKYTIALTKETDSADVPLEYSVDGTNWKTDVTQLNVTDATINGNNGEATLVIKWKWAYEQTNVTTGDTADTQLGKDSATANRSTVTIKADVTVTQDAVS